VYEDHSLILVRPDLHVVWRGHDNGRDELPSPEALAALATGNSDAVGLPRLTGGIRGAATFGAGEGCLKGCSK
jgi:hypothetical protein